MERSAADWVCGEAFESLDAVLREWEAKPGCTLNAGAY